eukprot:6184995-Pleurochrysis_carterae.AAC.1
MLPNEAAQAVETETATAETAEAEAAAAVGRVGEGAIGKQEEDWALGDAALQQLVECARAVRSPRCPSASLSRFARTHT